MEQRTEGCVEVPTARKPHEPAGRKKDGGEAKRAGKKALRNAVRRTLLCGQCGYRGNTIPLASIGKIAHKDMVKSLHVSLGSASIGCRHLEWLPVSDSVSPVCPPCPGAIHRRKKGFSGIGVSTLSVAVLRDGVKSSSTSRASKTFTLFAFKGPNWLSTATGICFLEFLLADELPRSNVGSQRGT